MAEIHKAHKPDSDPLEPRVTRSKSKSLNIDDLIKGAEVNASSSNSESDAAPSSDAPLIRSSMLSDLDLDAPHMLVIAANKKRKRTRVKFQKVKVWKTLDPSLPPTPTLGPQRLSGLLL
jgi:hypothetical protein